ncbi:sulfatase, partial [bacterium]|nr:sulfatase [candidate division CSSED10-310 bacterium]
MYRIFSTLLTCAGNRILLPVWIGWLILSGCAEPEPVEQLHRILAPVSRYRSIHKIARPVVPAGEEWQSEWFEVRAADVLTVHYGIPTDVETTSDPDEVWRIMADDQRRLRRTHRKEGRISQQLLPLGIEPDSMAPRTGTVLFRITAHMAGDDPVVLREDTIAAGDETAATWRVLETRLPASGRWRLRCTWNVTGGKDIEGVFSVPRLAAPGKPDRRGIVLISIDTLRADHVSAYGYDRNVTPHLDRLAKHGTVFANARSTSSWTLPAHVSLFSGLEPLVHHVRNPGDPPLDANHPALAELFVNHGWRTAAFTAGAYVSPRWGIERGFQCFDYSGESAAGIFTTAEHWLEQNSQTPFFLFIHHYDVHMPYNQHNPRPILSKPGLNSWGLTQTVSPLPLGDLVDLYDDGLRHADTQLGAFLTYLAGHHLLDDTTIIVLSDHGEEFADHGGFLHSLTLYEELVRIPLIIRQPGITSAHLDSSTRNLIDVYPTICRMAGIEPPAFCTGDLLQPVIRRRLEVAETARDYQTISLLDGDLKYIVSDEFGLKSFDLMLDPAERFSLGTAPLILPHHLRLLQALTEGDRGRLQLLVTKT